MRLSPQKPGGAMLAIDTNIVVLYLTGDHPEQASKAREIVDGERVYLATTMILETEWVLRGALGYRGETLASALRAFAGLPTVTLEDPARVATALDALAQGLDFADALHLAAARDCEAFVTFDQAFIRKAKRLGGLEVRAP